MRIRAALPVTALAAAVSVALYAVHATPMSHTKHVVATHYSIDDIVQFLVFNTGQVVIDHPDLDEHRPPARLSVHDARHVVESVNRCVDHLDAAAVPALTSAFNAADPQRIDNALKRFDAAAQHWLSGPATQNAPCPDPLPPPTYGGDNGGYQDPGGKGWWRTNGYGYLYYVLYGADFYAVAFTVGGAVAISLAAAVALVFFVAASFVLVPVFITYQFATAATDLDHQIALAKLARTLRS